MNEDEEYEYNEDELYNEDEVKEWEANSMTRCIPANMFGTKSKKLMRRKNEK